MSKSGKVPKNENEDDKLFIHDRWNRILTLLSTEHVTPIEKLSESLNVSAATVRRDLNKLDEIGELTRVRGGAIATDHMATARHGLRGQESYSESADANMLAKQKIGQYAASLLGENEAIIIDGGTTTEQLAHAINTPNLTVLTTSISILNALYAKPDIRILVTGGEVFPQQNIILNPYGDNIIKKYSASKIFLGAQAITERGLLQTDPLLVHYEQDLINQADEVILLADSSKFKGHGSLTVCGLDRIDRVITDNNIAGGDIDMLKSHNIKLSMV